MRAGLYLPNQAEFADVRALASLAHDAESAGWDGVFIWDELIPVYDYAAARAGIQVANSDTGAAADAMVALTAIAAATERIRFGPLVVPLPRLRPEVFAHQAAMLDQFSGGRLILGVGLGNPDTQFSAFGYPTDARVRAAQLDEFLDLVNRLWSGETMTFEGAHYVARNVAIRPTPAQRPRIPIWIGADSGRRVPRRRAARWDGFAPASTDWPTGVITPAEFREITSDIRARRTTADPFDLVLIGDARGQDPSATQLGDYADAGVTWLLAQALTLSDARTRIAAGPPA